MTRLVLGGLVKRRPQPHGESGRGFEVACVLKRPSDTLAQHAPRREIDTARRARVQVLQDFVVRFCEPFLRQKRIGHVTDIAAFHGSSSLRSANGSRPLSKRQPPTGATHDHGGPVTSVRAADRLLVGEKKPVDRRDHRLQADLRG
jgi:hypothetical protein